MRCLGEHIVLDISTLMYQPATTASSTGLTSQCSIRGRGLKVERKNLQASGNGEIDSSMSRHNLSFC